MCRICESAATVLQAAEELTKACIDSVSGSPRRKAPGARRFNRAFPVNPTSPADMLALMGKIK